MLERPRRLRSEQSRSSRPSRSTLTKCAVAMHAAPRSGSLLKRSQRLSSGLASPEGLHSRRGLTTWHHCCAGGRIGRRRAARPARSTSPRALPHRGLRDALAPLARPMATADDVGNAPYTISGTRALDASDQVSSRRRWASSCCPCLTSDSSTARPRPAVERTLNGRKQPSLSPRRTRPSRSNRRCRMRGGSASRLHVIQARS